MKREGREHVLVVFRPPTEESPLNVVVEQPTNGEDGPNVCQVVRSPNRATRKEDWGMEVLENLPLPAKEVERKREEEANEEPPQETVVDGTSAEHLLWPKGTPDDGSGEEIVGRGAGEVILLLRCANIGDLRHLIVEGSCADESGNKRGEHLAAERDPRWNVDVMGEFETLGVVEGARDSDVSVDLEVVHGGGVTGKPETTEPLSNNVEGDLYIGSGQHDTARNTKDDSEEGTIQHDSGGSVGGVNGNASGTGANGDTQHDEVGPLGDLVVRPHQPGVDVLGIDGGRSTTNQVLETRNDLATVV